MSRVMLLFAALATTLITVGEALAQRNLNVAAAFANEQRVALVIGNSAYEEALLRNPVNDATDMAAMLRALGFAVTLRANADTRQMRTAIREFAQNLKRGGVGLFYFAGHGVQSRNGRNYLIPVGADLKEEFELEDEAVDANRVLAGMEEAGNRVNIVILDACRNNPFARSWRSVANGLAQMSAPTGSFIGFATAPGQVAADGSGRNGLYTKHLLENLKAGDPDIDRVFTRVTAAVAKETGNKQVPWKSSSLTGDFFFRPPAGGPQVATVAPPAPISAPTDSTANDRAFWESVKDSKDPEDFKAYLEQFPNGQFAGLARNRLRALAPVQLATVAPSTQTTPTPVAALADSLQRLNPGTVFNECDGCPEMVVISAGSYTMGSPASEPNRDKDEGPQHQVTIARQFAAGKFEVTRGHFARFVQEAGYSTAGGCNVWTGSQWNNDASKDWRNPGFSQTDNDPVACVNWNDAKAYADWLKRKTGRDYRLLTEAEWEYVARAGTTTAFSWGDSITPQQANYGTTASYAGSPTAASRGRTAPVGSYAPNGFGLYDVHGNVWEWTEDCWNANYGGAPANGDAWAAGDCGRRVLRGGSWISDPRGLRSALRTYGTASGRNYSSGFRLARTD